ncbi:unnamed protein product [Effrenium voratum]|uniref:Uncharacterized protein n=1 Tax=Effrenium voratum TaxID=2562239 RepID=A0AA36HZ03_9DINO|nr:unnamed protein product [Effrenium voratum]
MPRLSVPEIPFGPLSRAVLGHCWRLWCCMCRNETERRAQQHAQVLVGGRFWPRAMLRRSLAAAWRCWQRLCGGSARPAPQWLKAQRLTLCARLGRLADALRQDSWLPRAVLAAWFGIGFASGERLRLRAQRAQQADAMLMKSLANEISSAAVADAAAYSAKSDRFPGGRKAKGLVASLLRRRGFAEARRWVAAWRLQSAKERAFDAMLELSLEDGESFLASPITAAGVSFSERLSPFADME